MRAIVYAGAGGTEVISVEERVLPEPGSNELLVRVRAAGLNRADIIQRRGGYPAPPGWPADVPGLEYAGVVEGVGREVTRWRIGDRVMGLVGGGAHAELLVAGADEVLAIPAALDDVLAAAVPEAFLTAWDALVIRARLAPGERALVHAVGSGIGTVAMQLIKWLGGTAIGTSRTASKLEQAARLGLDEGIDTSERGFAEQLSAPVDVILDCLGAASLPANLAALAPRGRLVLLGTLQGAVANGVDLGRVLRGRLEVIGTVMRSRARDERVSLVEAFTERVLPALGGSNAPLRPVIGAVYPVDQVRLAHEAMEDNAVFGKIVLTW